MSMVVILVIFGMLAINAVFAAYEIALASVSLASLQLLARENRAGAKTALYMKQNMETTLAALQVGVTLAGAIAAATGGAGANESLAPLLEARFGLSEGWAEFLAIILVVVPLTVFTVMFSELAPKFFAIRNKEFVCLILSASMRWFTWVVWPVVWLLENGVTSVLNFIERRWRRPRDLSKRPEAALQELRAQAAMARASRLIGAREEGIILGAARLSRRSIGEAMLPADDISMLDVNQSLSSSLIAAHLDMHTRFPVTERPGDPQAIIGYVNFKDIVALMRLSHAQKLSLRNVVRALPSLEVDLPIASCMERLIHEHSHIALVRDAQRKVVGMITLEDILEELVGEIQDEYDRLPAHAVPSGAAWVVGGGLSLTRLKDVTGMELANDPPAQAARTVNEWITAHLADGVSGGEVLDRDNLRVIVRKIRRKKVLEAQISRKDQPQVEGASEVLDHEI